MILIADSPYAELSSRTAVNFYILVVEERAENDEYRKPDFA